MKDLRILTLLFSFATITYCQAQVIVIFGADPTGPVSLEAALNDLDSGFFESHVNELKPTDEDTFVEKYEFEVARYIRRKWGVLGGSALLNELSQGAAFHPRLLSNFILRSYYQSFYDDASAMDEKLPVEIRGNWIPKPKKYTMQFKIRNGIEVPNCRFKVSQVNVHSGLDTSLGTLYPTGKKVSELVVKKPLKTYLNEWLDQSFFDETNVDVQITIRDFYAEIAARTWGTEMAVYLDIDVSSSEIKRNYSYIEIYEPKLIYTGVNVNKALEDLLEKVLIEFNNELIK